MRRTAPLAMVVLLVAANANTTAIADDQARIRLCNPDWDAVELRVTRGQQPACDDNEEVYSGRMERGHCVNIKCETGAGDRVCWRSRVDDLLQHDWSSWRHEKCAFDRDYDL